MWVIRLLLINLVCNRIGYVRAVDPLVDVLYSKYLGTALPNGISQWLGIRYATPPLGDRRFRTPIDPPVNNTVQVADKHGSLCLETGAVTLPVNQSEDCLFLDVFAPSNATSHSKLPVFFWIQGGGLNRNNNANYNGSELIISADMDMVIVTHNFRLSLYGFLAGEEVADNGDINVGLLDQRKALEWVHEHISKFGGDPDHVVLGGNSGGAQSIVLHMTAFSGAPTNLFHAVIAESQSFPLVLNVTEVQFQYDALVGRVGCANSSDSLACLRSLGIRTLQSNNIDLPFPGRNNTSSSFYRAVLDDTFLRDYPHILLKEGKFVKVPSVFGDATDEGTFFAPNDLNSTSDMNDFLLDTYFKLNASMLDMIDRLYPPSEQIPNHGVYFPAAAKAYGEMRYICPGIFISNQIRNFRRPLPNWLWRYNVDDPDQVEAGLGVPHTVEVFAIWGLNSTTDGLPGKPASLNTINAGIIPVIRGYWTSFIRSFNPNTYRASGTPEWTAFDGKRRILLETNTTRMESIPPDQQARCAYLTSIAEEIGQ